MEEKTFTGDGKLIVTVSGLLECLDEGMTREQIAEHYGISLKEVSKHFKHPKLKGKKPKKPMESVLLDDTEMEVLDKKPVSESNNDLNVGVPEREDLFSDYDDNVNSPNVNNGTI